MSVALPVNEKAESRAGLFSFASFPEEAISRRFRVNPAQIIKLLRIEIESLIERLVMARSVEEFQRRRKLVFESYINLCSAITKVVLTTMEDSANHEQLVQEALTKIEEDFRVEGPLHLGAEASKEAVFSIATLKRTFRLIPRIVSNPVPDDKKNEDKELAKQFSSCVLWSQLHLDCLGFALERKEALAPEVLGEVLEGIRLSLTAYACARQGYDIRALPRTEPVALEGIEWDDEDENLVAISLEESNSIPDEW